MNKKFIIISTFVIANLISTPLLLADKSCADANCNSKAIKGCVSKSMQHKSCFSQNHNNTQSENCDCIYCYECEAKKISQIRINSNFAKEEIPKSSFHLRIEQKIDIPISQSPDISFSLDFFVKTVRLLI